MAFPRTLVGGKSLSRIIIGTNWFLGYSHASPAKDELIKSQVLNRKAISEILQVFLHAGVDTLMGLPNDILAEAIRDAEDRVGRKITLIVTPFIPAGPSTPEKGLDQAEVAKILAADNMKGATFCMPHMACTDNLVDRCTRKIRHMDQLCRMIREQGFIPGLSTHMPEAIVYADESGLDVETYISIYNSMGFLMQLEVDWVHHIIANAKKPVMTIKPMAAGQLRPFQALAFVWTTLRDQDMVTIGTMTPREAEECIDHSLNILENRKTGILLQETRSKASVKTAKK
jgi:hypothetical protein